MVFEIAPGNKRLHRRHHPNVTHVVNGAHAVLRPETAVEHRQMLRLQIGRAFDRPGRIDVRDNLLHLLGCIARV